MQSPLAPSIGLKAPFQGRNGKSHLTLPRPLNSTMLSLPSPNSPSSSSPSSPSSSSTSQMLASALQQTVLSPVGTNQQHHQHQHQQTSQQDSLDFDHLASMWTPPSEASPPLSVGDFFHSFIPMNNLSPVPVTVTNHTSSSNVSNQQQQQQQQQQSLTFIEMTINQQTSSANQQSSQQTLLDPLSIVSLDVAPSISLSPPLSASSPSMGSGVSSCNSASSSTGQLQQYTNPNGTMCMLYS